MPPSCICPSETKGGHAWVHWVGEYFADCVYTNREVASFYLGLSSIACWCFCQAPQFYENYRRGRCESLSKWFLVIWLTGDLSNLVGSVLTDQLPTQQYTAMLFVSMDALMVAQYSYYTCIVNKSGRPRKGAALRAEKLANDLKAEHVPLLDTDDESEDDEEAGRASSLDAGSPRHAGKHAAVVGSEANMGSAASARGSTILAAKAPILSLGFVAAVSLVAAVAWSSASTAHPSSGEASAAGHGSDRSSLAAVNMTSDATQTISALLNVGVATTPPSCIRAGPSTPWIHTLGMVLGWMSSVLYICSRMPQVYRNAVRKSVEGLSWMMFTSAVMGNVTYGTSILLRLRSGQDAVEKLPWLIGSLGTLAFDATILLQLRWYSKPHPPTGYTPHIGRDGRLRRRRDPPQMTKSEYAVYVTSGRGSPKLFGQTPDCSPAQTV
eukprot:g2698.t1